MVAVDSGVYGWSATSFIMELKIKSHMENSGRDLA